MPQPDRAFLTEVRQSSSTYFKNISYRPKEDRVRGVARGSADAEALCSIMRAYSREVIGFAARFLAPYASGWKVDLASFRSVEESGRKLATKARNDLLHVDAFPTRPTNGGRILRVFTNINPAQPRVWLTGEPFAALAGGYAGDAGLAKFAAQARSPWRPLRRLLPRLAHSAGLPVADRSPYDAFMLGFHDYLKRNRAFQETSPKSQWEFPPNSTWIVFTDTVPHAVLSGQFALEQTFIVPRQSLVAPDRAPVSILEKLCGSPLTN